jgi:hypothetical protein
MSQTAMNLMRRMRSKLHVRNYMSSAGSQMNICAISHGRICRGRQDDSAVSTGYDGRCDRVFGGRFVTREKQQRLAERVVSENSQTMTSSCSSSGTAPGAQRLQRFGPRID